MQCLTTRDFGLVDQDQSDNVTTSYLFTGNNQIAQNTAANLAQLAANGNGNANNVNGNGNANNANVNNQAAAPAAAPQVLTNASDNLLLVGFEDKALGCTPMMAPDLADNGALKPSLPLYPFLPPLAKNTLSLWFIQAYKASPRAIDFNKREL